MRKGCLGSIFIILILFGLLADTASLFAQTPPLTIVNLKTALKAIRQKQLNITYNELIERIKNRRVDFNLTSSRESELIKAGAPQEVIDAIRENGPDPVETKPFTIVDVFRALKKGKTPDKQKSLISQIQTRKVNGKLTQEEEDYFVDDGANPDLIAAIKDNPAVTEKITVNPSDPIKTVKNSIGMEFVLMKKGSFSMGSEIGADDEKPVRTITFPEDFYMGRYEVTQGQWQEVMGDTEKKLALANVVDYSQGDNFPIVWVSWDEAKLFISKLNERNDGFVYSLPSEAEWEYGCRGGTNTKYAFGDTISLDQANFKNFFAVEVPTIDTPDKDINMIREVGSYKQNKFGLFDMHGNVWEWVEDTYGSNYKGLKQDGTANTKGDAELRVMRGGSWATGINSYLRCSARYSDKPDKQSNQIGFRVVARKK